MSDIDSLVYAKLPFSGYLMRFHGLIFSIAPMQQRLLSLSWLILMPHTFSGYELGSIHLDQDKLQ